MAIEKKSHNLAAVLWLIFFFPVGFYFVWAKTNWNKKVKWGITNGFILPLIISAIVGNLSPSSDTSSKKTEVAAQQVTTQPTAIPQATNTPTPTPTPVPKDVNGFPMDAEAVTVANLDKAPSQYEGQKLTFTCTVAGFAKDSSGNAAAVNCSDPNDYSSIVQVSTPAFDMTQIKPQDTVRFYGLGEGATTGKNAFGGDVSETIVTGIYINDLTSGYKE